MPATLLIVSLGELGTNVLEAAGRSGLFDRIVVASRSVEKARARINNALIGCGIDGFFPDFEAIGLDFNDPACVATLRRLAPDIVFSAPTLLPWWKVGGLDGATETAAEKVPFGGYVSLQLAPMATFRARLADSGLAARWIAASFPDVINPCLARTGFGPDCGIGNVREPIAKIQASVGRRLGVPPTQVEVRLVAQHAFEYGVFQAQPPTELPPYLLEVTVDGQDRTALGHEALREPFPFPYDLHFNRITASAAIDGMRALLSSSPMRTHLPGVLGLVGGYPVSVEAGRIRLDLPAHWSEAQAIATNEASLPWDGIARIESDGTIVFTAETVEALHALTGTTIESAHPDTAASQAALLLGHLV
ncbi:hypothetical protein ASE66_06745 [Bosea sp. Root483D1]|uniref:hypothetical protein n=1 Tax=Bosea sp. Root483D1 TaxID=1736544 RepID=UPI0007111555|nr:hypothetical protein [Bosea sp. Root483D1]KRE20557.1 hypothetical protein ASE66_06745 [Bosea sp. Root483D1]